MADKKKNKPSASPTPADMMKDFQKRTKSIYSVNGKYNAQLTEHNEGGWICAIWSIAEDGSMRPMLRNVQPFVTMEEAIQLAQRCFAQYTGDDRYFAKEDVRKENKPD